MNYSSFSFVVVLFLAEADFAIQSIITINNTTPPMVPVLILSDKSIALSAPTTAKIARIIPIKPSPAMRPEQKRTPELLS